MDEILETLSHTPGVNATLLVGKDGLVISQAGRTDDVETDRVGATASEIFTSSESLISNGGFETLTFEGGGGRFFLNAVSDEVFLLVLASKKANLGMVRWETRESAGKLKDVM